MNIYIYGAGYFGKIIQNIIKNNYSNLIILGFIDRAKKGGIDGIPIFSLGEIDNDELIVISLHDRNTAIEICDDLKAKGFHRIWWYNGRGHCYGHSFLEEFCIDCSGWKEPVLPQVEMHIMDSCNLNCRGCSHFSPIFSEIKPDITSRLHDVLEFKKKFGHIIRFVILGGEPFLNPEIMEYIKGIRSILPDTWIEIVTNGLLIPKLGDDVFCVIKENNVMLSISEYLPTHKIIDRICSRIEEFEIRYDVRRYEAKQKFNIPLAIPKNSTYPKKCISNGCITIWNGKMSRCPTLMYIGEFNRYYGTSLPEEGTLPISNPVCGYELLEYFKKDVSLCEHCVENEVEWSSCGNNPILEDFAINK